MTEEALCAIFATDPSLIYWRTRKRREKIEQYEKRGESQAFFVVQEYGVKFWVNLVDYLDTGLFLDHRETRQLVAAAAKGKRLLNLFAYTCSFSVHAAHQGASFTKSVDMSNTYTAWGTDNFALNALSLAIPPLQSGELVQSSASGYRGQEGDRRRVGNHEVVRADCLKFLEEEIRSRAKYDIIVIDPPTVSRSKKMEGLFDVQEDYIFLMNSALKLLTEGGVIFFSTNSRKFVFDASLFVGCSVVDISSHTIPLDFHDQKVHRCWKIIP